ncbi:YkyA family protein [Chryseomicrobium palamuruense]
MKKWVGIVSVSALLLAGCTFGDSTEQQLSEVLQQMHTAEEEYRSVQDPLNEAEQKEYALFEEVLALEQEQTDELTEKLEELSALVAERRDLLSTEKQSIDAALEASDFSTLDIPEENQSYVTQIDETYDARYATYEQLYSEYEKLLALQENLYTEMAREDVAIDQIRDLVQQVNAQNEVVQTQVTAMNEQTEQFNQTTDEVFESLQNEE